jgi:hypothetical protein
MCTFLLVGRRDPLESGAPRAHGGSSIGRREVCPERMARSFTVVRIVW